MQGKAALHDCPCQECPEKGPQGQVVESMRKIFRRQK